MATKSEHTDFAVIDQKLLNIKAENAAVSERLREIHIFHEGDADTLQRMLNAVQPKSYIAPHRHIATPKAESLIILKGSIGFVGFHNDGSINENAVYHLSAESDMIGIDYRAGVWHTFFALTKDTVLFEVKPGPYNSHTDKEFAKWAPSENSPEALPYLAKLEDIVREKYSLTQRSWNY